MCRCAYVGKCVQSDHCTGVIFDLGINILYSGRTKVIAHILFLLNF